jgi:hypothetical protein
MKNPLYSDRLPAILVSFVVIIALLEALFVAYLALENSGNGHILRDFALEIAHFLHVLACKLEGFLLNGG